MLKHRLLALGCCSIIASQAQLNLPWNSSAEAKTKVNFEKVEHQFEKQTKEHQKPNNQTSNNNYHRWNHFWSTRLTPSKNIPQTPEQYNTSYFSPSPLHNTLLSEAWQPLGPNYMYPENTVNGPGRVSTVTCSPTGDGTIFLGTPTGGLWKSTDNGISWRPAGDLLPSMGIASIDFDPQNAQIMYLNTGDPDHKQSYFSGVFKSLDGGMTWRRSGLSFPNETVQGGKIAVSPSNSSIIWAATSKGLFKSENAGADWTNVLSQPIFDFELNPETPDDVYVAAGTWGKVAVYKSDNGGQSFSIVNNNIPSDAHRIELATTPANSQFVYALVFKWQSRLYGFDGLYLSTDQADRFEKINDNQLLFESSKAINHMSLSVSEQDEEVIYMGARSVWKSDNAGESFAQISNPDLPNSTSFVSQNVHQLKLTGATLFACTDGGIYRSTDEGDSFESLHKGLNIGQFLALSSTPAQTEVIVGGTIGNGAFHFNGTTWKNFVSGDIASCEVNPANSNQLFVLTPFGEEVYGTRDGGFSYELIATKPSFETSSFSTPIVIQEDGTTLVGYQSLYELKNGEWEMLGDYVFEEGISELSLHPTDPNTMFASVDNNLYLTSDKGFNWDLVHSFPKKITSINHHANLTNTLYISLAHYDHSGTPNKVFKSSDQGNSWTNITYDLPDSPVQSIRHIPGTNNGILVGTDAGVFYLNGASTHWTKYATGLPLSPITDMAVSTTENRVRISTFGRGIWEAPLPEVIPQDIYCASSHDSRSFKITRVQLDEMTHTSDWEDHHLFSDEKITIGEQQSVSFNIAVNQLKNESKLGIWVDWNQDLDFDDADELVYYNLDQTAYTGQFELPESITSGEFRLRIRFTNGISLSPCGESTYGETEDYVLQVEPREDYCQVGTQSSSLFIKRIETNTTNNESEYGAGGYDDFTAITIPHRYGESMHILMEASTLLDNGFKGGVFIDWNHDLDFSDEDESYPLSNFNTTFEGEITPPEHALFGETRIRFAVTAASDLSACESSFWGEFEDYTFELQAPFAPVASFSSTDADIDAGGLVRFTNESSNEVEELTWLFEGGTPAYSTDENPEITYVLPGEYNVTLIASNRGGSDTLVLKDYVKVNEIQNNYCGAWANNSYWMYLEEVALGGIEVTSRGTEGYMDFTYLEEEVSIGQSFQVSLTPGYAYTLYPMYFTIYVDFDRDGSFGKLGEEVFYQGPSISQVNGLVTVPDFAKPGKTRMRVIASYYANQIAWCGARDFGQVMDFTLSIQNSGFSQRAMEEDGFDSESQDQELKIYPTIANYQLNLGNAKEQEYNYQLINWIGQTVQEGTISSDAPIRLGNEISNGQYLVKLMNEDKQSTHSITVSR